MRSYDFVAALLDKLPLFERVHRTRRDGHLSVNSAIPGGAVDGGTVSQPEHPFGRHAALLKLPLEALDVVEGWIVQTGGCEEYLTLSALAMDQLHVSGPRGSRISAAHLQPFDELGHGNRDLEVRFQFADRDRPQR